MKMTEDKALKNPNDILKYEGMVKTIISRYSKSGIPRDELFSDAWMGVIRGLQTFDESKGMKISSWVFLNITFSIKTAVTMQGRYSERVILSSDTFVFNSNSTSQGSYSSNKDDGIMDAELLYSAVSKLSERKKTILVRVYLCGETQQNVATSLGISQSWCSRLLKNILNELRENIRKWEKDGLSS